MKKSKVLLVALVAFSLVLTGCTDAVKTKKEEVSKVIKTAAVDSSVRSDLMDRLEAAKTVEEITAIADEIEAAEAVAETINETIAQVDDLIRTINTKGDMENAAVKEISDSLFILKAEFIITNAADFDVTAAQAKIQELTEKVNAAVGA